MDKRAKFTENYQRLSRCNHVKGSIIVRLSSEDSKAAIRAAGFRIGKPYGFKGYHKIRFTGDAQAAMDALSKIEGVENAEPEILPEPDADFTPNDTYAETQLDYMLSVDVARMWDIYNEHKARVPVYEQIIGVCDYRFDTAHEDVNWKLPGFNSGDGTDYTDIHPDYPTYYHGIGCAGILGAKTNNGKGVFGLGLNCAAFPLAIMPYYESRLEVDIITAAITKCVELGIRVFSMSMSYPEPSEYIEAACNYARDRGLIVCASSSNNSSTSARWPARYDSVFGVSGLAAVEGKGTKTIHLNANYGPGVDFCAPYETYSTGLDNTYRMFNGTSAATPYIAACVANVLTINPRLTWAGVKAIMIRSCERESFQAGDSRRPTLYGYGIPQFAKAVELAIQSLPYSGLYSDKGRLSLYQGDTNGIPVPLSVYYGLPDGTPRLISAAAQ